MSDAGDSCSALPDGRAWPERRVVVLGASNVTRAISTITRTAERLWGAPLDLLTALGHGRSYGWRINLLGRALPSIESCALWPALARRPPAPTAALVTDIGNDLLYGGRADQIAGWVETCVDRLQASGARVVMTELPTFSLEKLPRWKFGLFRRLFFPFSRVTYEQLQDEGWRLQERIVSLAGQRGIALRPHDESWYGFDPIHIKLRHWHAAWRQFMAPWHELQGEELPPPVGAAPATWLRLRLSAPHERALFGITQRRAQPCLRLASGTLVSIY